VCVCACVCVGSKKQIVSVFWDERLECEEQKEGESYLV